MTVDPSRADRQVTVALRDACAVVGTPLLDHIIVTDNGYLSFSRGRGLGPAGKLLAAGCHGLELSREQG